MLIIIMLLWIALGLLLWWWFQRPRRSTGGVRTVDRAVVAVGERVQVRLRLFPPLKLAPAEPRDIVLVIDCSYSMGGAPGTPLYEAQQAICALIPQLSATDRVAVVSFAENARCACPWTANKRQLLQVVKHLRADGGTAIANGLERAGRLLDESRADVQTILILLTDGADFGGQVDVVTEQITVRHPGLRLACAAMGEAATELALLQNIVSAPELLVGVREAKDVFKLYVLLTRALAAESPNVAQVHERIEERTTWSFNTPRSGLVPNLYKRQDQRTCFTWQQHGLGTESWELNYELHALRSGWHAVAEGEVVWHFNPQLEDGLISQHEQVKHALLKGPRVLVLPVWLYWAWWLITPLLAWLFNKSSPKVPAEQVVNAQNKLPRFKSAALPTGQSEPNYRPGYSTSLVLGLGDFGGQVIDMLATQAGNYRGMRSEHVPKVVKINFGQSSDSASVHTATVIKQLKSIDLAYDFRSLLSRNGTTNQVAKPIWIPILEWRQRNQCLHTYRGVSGERALARLALEQVMEDRELDAELGTLLTQIEQYTPRQLFIIAHASDAAASGVLAVLARYCANRSNAAIRVILAPDTPAWPHGGKDGAEALAHELARLVENNERSEASRLFAHILILERQILNPNNQARSLAQLAWCLSAYRGPNEHLTRIGTNSVLRCSIEAQARPSEYLWRVACDRLTLEYACRWIGIHNSESNAPLYIPAVHNDRYDDMRRQFWSGRLECVDTEGETRVYTFPDGFCLRQDQNTERLFWVWHLLDGSDLGLLPEYRRRGLVAKQTQEFVDYVYVWLYQQWSDGRTLAEVCLVLDRADAEFNQLIREIENQPQSEQSRLEAVILAKEIGRKLQNLARDYLRWFEELSGCVSPSLEQELPLRQGLLYQHAQHCFRAWPAEFEQDFTAASAGADGFEALLQQVRSERLQSVQNAVALLPVLQDHQASSKLGIMGIADVVEEHDPKDFLPILCNWLEPLCYEFYSRAEWDWLEQASSWKAYRQDSNTIQVGNEAGTAPEQDKDPDYRAVLQFHPTQLPEALVTGTLTDRGKSLPYVLNEEMNAQRLEQVFAHAYERYPEPLPRAVMALLNEPARLYQVLLALAAGEVVLVRDGLSWNDIPVAYAGIRPPLDHRSFSQVLQALMDKVDEERAVAGQEDQGERRELAPDILALQLNKSELFRMLAEDERKAWLDLAQTLAIDIRNQYQDRVVA